MFNLSEYTIILASNSPRRKELLGNLGLSFEVQGSDVEEITPEGLPIDEVAEYLSALKGKDILAKLEGNPLIIASDTVVRVDDEILGKPKDRKDAIRMLQLISGRAHRVTTGVYLGSKEKEITFSDTTKVYFKELTTEEIHHYIDTYQPYDKAGSYGIQEWIGLIAIQKIEGSFYSVMGLPVARLYAELEKWS